MTNAEDAAGTARSARMALLRRRTATVTAVTASVLLTLSLAGTVFAAGSEKPLLPTWLPAIGILLGLTSSVAIVWRHEYPLRVTALSLVPPVLASSALAALITLAALAAARRDRMLWICTGAVLIATGVTLWLDANRAVAASILQRAFGAEPGGAAVDVPLIGVVLIAVVLTAIPLGVGLLRGTRRDLERGAHNEEELRGEVARRDERTRIAREMHDVLGHRLSQLSLQAGALEVSTSDSADAARTVGDTTRAALDDLRQVIGVLRDGRGFGTAEDSGQAPNRPQPTLADAPELITSSRESGLTINTTVLLDDATSAPAQLGTAAYRILQESLTNALRHAPMATVEVTLRGGPGTGVHIAVANPLPAEDATSTPGSGSGLTGIFERVKAMDGTLSTGPTERDTFEVVAWLPWPERS